eukprot:scaffold30289_cov47-Phaeocystis_antarctica.AAC.1
MDGHLDVVGEHLPGSFLARVEVVQSGGADEDGRDLERLVEALPAEVLLLDEDLSQYRLHRRARLLAHVRLAVLVPGSAHRLLGRRVDARAQILRRCNPRRRLRCALGRKQAVPGVRVPADEAARHLVEARVDLVLLAWQAHEAGLRRRRPIDPRDVVEHLGGVNSVRVRG